MKGDSPKLFSSKGERDNVWTGEIEPSSLVNLNFKNHPLKDEGS